MSIAYIKHRIKRMFRKPKLLIVVGAGASIELGMPSVADIDKIFEDSALKYYSLVSNNNESLYTHVRDEINSGLLGAAGSQRTTNYEEVLFTLLHLSALSNDYPQYTPKYFLSLNSFPEVIEFKSTSKKTDSNTLRQLASLMIDDLLKEFRQRCLNVKEKIPDDFDLFKSFFEQLSNDYQLGIFSLNHDNLILQALPTLFNGFDRNSGAFLPEKILKTKKWDFCYYLHGSVHFDMSGDKYNMHGVKWNDNLPAISDFKQNSSGRSPQITREGIGLPTSAIITGYDKISQMQREPFRTYYNRLDSAILEADAVMYLGYGFSDDHVNTCIKDRYNKLTFSNKKPVMVVDWAGDKYDSLHFRRDDWAINLIDTLNLDYKFMSSPGHTAPALISNLRKNKECEVSNSSDYPVSIWYNGFLELCRNYEKINEYINYHKK